MCCCKKGRDETLVDATASYISRKCFLDTLKPTYLETEVPKLPRKQATRNKKGETVKMESRSVCNNKKAQHTRK